jgi:predicted RNA-binding protein with EMAP domain
MNAFVFAVTLVCWAGLLCGCATSDKQLLETEKGQVELREIQSRAFETTDREKTLRTIMATLQDLGFVIDKADATLGTVTATKLDRYALRMTVTVRPRGEKSLMVRASAQFNERAVVEPAPYQQFFNSLSKAMFLEAQQVE